MPMNPSQLKNLLEAALLAAGQPLSLEKLQSLFPEGEVPDRDELRAGLEDLREDCASRGVELKEVASGYRMQVRQEFAPWIARLYEERPPRYSRALLETLVLIAYRQPISRAEIEEIRGVSVSTNIIKTLQERDWIRVVGFREVPGRPALFGTTREFLDYFNLKNLSELPPLSEIRSLEAIASEMELELAQVPVSEDEGEAVATEAVADTTDNADESEVLPRLSEVEAAVRTVH